MTLEDQILYISEKLELNLTQKDIDYLLSVLPTSLSEEELSEEVYLYAVSNAKDLESIVKHALNVLNNKEISNGYH
jgi:hypothetical protein